jgi:hypothetical protein
METPDEKSVHAMNLELLVSRRFPQGNQVEGQRAKGEIELHSRPVHLACEAGRVYGAFT